MIETLEKELIKSLQRELIKTLQRELMEVRIQLLTFNLTFRKGKNTSRQVYVLDRSAETFVLLGVVVLETDLNLHRFQEVPLLVLRLLEDRIYTLVKSVPRHLRPKEEENERNQKISIAFKR